MASIVDPEHINVVCYAFVVALILWIFYNCTRIYTWSVMRKAVSRGTYYQYTYEELRSTSLKQKVLDDVREGAGQMIQLLPITPLRFYLRQQQISLQVIPQSDLTQTPTLRKGVFTEGVFSPTDGSRAFVFEGRPPVLPSAVATPQSGLSPGSTMFHHVRNGGSSSMDYSNWAAPGSAVMHPQVSSGGFDLFGTPSTVLQDNGFGAQPLWMGFDVAVHQATHTRSIAASALLTVNTSDLLKELWQSLVVPTQVSDGLPHASPPPTRRLWGGLVKFMSRVSVGSSNKRPLVTPMSTIRPPLGTIRRRGNSIKDMLRTPKSTALSQSTSADFHSAVSSAVGTPTTAGRDSEFPKGNDLLPTVGKKGTESSNFQRTLSSHLGPLSSSGQTIPMLRADGGVGELVPPALRLQDRGSASIRSADYDSANSLGNIDRNLIMSGSDAHASITSPLQARRGRQPLTIEVPQLTNFTPPLRPTPETRPPPREPCTPTSALVSDLPSALSDGSVSSPNQPSTSHQYPPPHYRSIAFANPMFADQLTQLEFLAEATTTAPQADSLDAALQKRGGIVERMIDTVEDTLSSRRWAPLDGSNDSPMFSSPSSFDDVTIPIVVVVEELPPVVASRRIGLIYTSTVSQSTVAQLASPSEGGGQTPAPLFDLQLSFMRIGTDLFRIYPIYNASTEDGGGTAGKRPCKYGGVDGIPVRCGGGPNFQKRQQNGVTDSFEPKADWTGGVANKVLKLTAPFLAPKATLLGLALRLLFISVFLGSM